MNSIKKILNLENLSTPNFLNLKKSKSSSLSETSNKLDVFKIQNCSTPKINIIFEKDVLYLKNSNLVVIVP
jgi:hypothetical protein